MLMLSFIYALPKETIHGAVDANSDPFEANFVITDGMPHLINL